MAEGHWETKKRKRREGNNHEIETTLHKWQTDEEGKLDDIRTIPPIVRNINKLCNLGWGMKLLTVYDDRLECAVIIMEWQNKYQ